MRVLVTGGAGFVGTNLIKRLLSEGHKVVSLDNYSTGLKENEIEQKGVQYFDVDLTETVNYDFFISKPDLIFHLAAIARIQPSFKHPVYTHHANVTATLNVLEWARGIGCPIVFAGSSSSNGDKFANPYTLSKSLSEQLVELYNKVYDLPTAICRFYNVYGPHQLTEGEYCTLIGIFQTLYKEGRPLTITDDGEQRRDFTHVDDIVDGLIRCGESIHEVSGELFELGRGKNYSVNEIAEAFGENYPTIHIDGKQGEMRETLCEDENANELLGWNPSLDVLDFIKENYVLDK
jgi:UDP-glucose 4-epimerase|tara:strand:- start:2938 stop:3810 length:873 start_codon:yes stop_codon:yes gene_type:complete